MLKNRSYIERVGGSWTWTFEVEMMYGELVMSFVSERKRGREQQVKLTTPKPTHASISVLNGMRHRTNGCMAVRSSVVKTFAVITTATSNVLVLRDFSNRSGEICTLFVNGLRQLRQGKLAQSMHTLIINKLVTSPSKFI